MKKKSIEVQTYRCFSWGEPGALWMRMVEARHLMCISLFSPRLPGKADFSLVRHQSACVKVTIR